MSLAAHSAPQEGFTSLLEHHLNKDLLRFTTAGSVDDGKSTLIGRLLYDSKAVYEDQLASVKKSRVNRSGGPIDFSLLTDGLRAEREQGITIDVAYRYFETPRRKFIIADTPGHEQYTRNMATGASTADLAVILVDATRGVLAQTRRHAYITSLLGIKHVVAAINKMDLLGYREDDYRRLMEDFLGFSAQLQFSDVTGIPISALAGDNLVHSTPNMPWYTGPTLLEYLETVPVPVAAADGPMRFPVQYVVRPDAEFRGFAGQIASGSVRAGDEVVALPSRQATRVRSIVTYDSEPAAAFAPMAVTLTLEDEIDVSRGDMLVSPRALPQVATKLDATVVWFDAQPLVPGRTYLLKHGVRMVRGNAVAVDFRVNMKTLEREPAEDLAMNDIGAVRFESAQPLFFDPYERNRATGSFIIIDLLSNATVGAAMIRGAAASEDAAVALWNTPVSEQERYCRHGHEPALIFVEDRPGYAPLLERALFAQGFEVAVVSGDQLPADRLNDLAKFSQSVGLILIYEAATLTAGEKSALSAVAADRILDLAAMELPSDHRAAAALVVDQVQLLCRPLGPAGSGE